MIYIILGLIIFILVLCLIGQLDDLCEYEKKIKKAIEYLKQKQEDNKICSVCNVITDDLLEILGDEDEKETNQNR